MSSRSRITTATLALGLAAVLAACSGETKSAGGSDSGSASEAAAAAKSRAAEFLRPPTDLAENTPLSKKPAAGKKIVWLQCSQPSCAVIGDGLKAATAKLGWTMSRITFSNTDPEAVITAMHQAIEAKPDGIALSGVPSSAYETALRDAKAAKIPVVTGAVIDEVGGVSGNGIIGLIGGTSSYDTASGAVADWVINDSKAKANVLVVTVDDFPIIKHEGDTVVRYINDKCPSCKVARMNQATADIATNTPNNVVSKLQSDPSIDYVYFGFGDLSRGVAPALKTAGSKVKIVGIAPTSENYQRVIDGEEAAWASWSTPLVGWGMADAFAREFNGDPLDAVKNKPMTIQLFAAENKPKTPSPIFPEGYEGLYAKLWKLS